MEVELLSIRESMLNSRLCCNINVRMCRKVSTVRRGPNTQIPETSSDARVQPHAGPAVEIGPKPFGRICNQKFV